MRGILETIVKYQCQHSFFSALSEMYDVFTVKLHTVAYSATILSETPEQNNVATHNI